MRIGVGLICGNGVAVLWGQGAFFPQILFEVVDCGTPRADVVDA